MSKNPNEKKMVELLTSLNDLHEKIVDAQQEIKEALAILNDLRKENKNAFN